jgi:hypothetical protein
VPLAAVSLSLSLFFFTLSSFNTLYFFIFYFWSQQVGYTHTRCFQSQRYQVYRGEGAGLSHLVFESSQVMQDIPYGDIFKVRFLALTL